MLTLDSAYSKTLNICGIKMSRFNENDILANFKLWRSWYTMVPKSKHFDVNK